MTDTGSTGRIDHKLTAAARKILFARKLDDQIDEEMPFICRIDCAHLLMLAECQIVSSEKAQKLLRALQALVGQHFAPLKARPSERGLFLLYEHYLIETEGSAVGGVLQTARSRNDLGATLLRLRLRRPCYELINAALRLQAVLVNRAHAYGSMVMPAYTHGQPAEPITYGHYLAGVAQAIGRDIDGILESIKEIDTCPLGAGAIAGTSLAIDTKRTASLLGFAQCSANSIDAVASRDVVLRLLAATAIYATTLSRIATDLLQWLTAEFQFLQAPDEIVGSSSAMPQKRNPFCWSMCKDERPQRWAPSLRHSRRLATLHSPTPLRLEPNRCGQCGRQCRTRLMRLFCCVLHSFMQNLARRGCCKERRRVSRMRPHLPPA